MEELLKYLDNIPRDIARRLLSKSSSGEYFGDMRIQIGSSVAYYGTVWHQNRKMLDRSLNEVYRAVHEGQDRRYVK